MSACALFKRGGSHDAINTATRFLQMYGKCMFGRTAVVVDLNGRVAAMAH